MLSVPAGKEDVVIDATPLEFRLALPMAVVPFRNVTVPVGVTVPDAAVTVAVKVTLCPVLT
jgi:hypothetical protein